MPGKESINSSCLCRPQSWLFQICHDWTLYIIWKQLHLWWRIVRIKGSYWTEVEGTFSMAHDESCAECFPSKLRVRACIPISSNQLEPSSIATSNVWLYAYKCHNNLLEQISSRLPLSYMFMYCWWTQELCGIHLDGEIIHVMVKSTTIRPLAEWSP